MVEGVCPRQCIEVISVSEVFPNSVLVVCDISTVSMPAHIIQRGFLVTVAWDPHPIVEHRISFIIVHYIEPNFVTFPGVSDFKKKPLVVPFRINIILHQTVIFLIWYFLCQV